MFGNHTWHCLLQSLLDVTLTIICCASLHNTNKAGERLGEERSHGVWSVGESGSVGSERGALESGEEDEGTEGGGV